MSLWRVKHTLSPIVEYALVAVVASYGLLAIYAVSLQPLAAATLSTPTALPQPVTLDTDAWSRSDDAAYGFAFGVPPGWIADQADPSFVRIGRSAKERQAAPLDGEGMTIESVALPPRQHVENLAASDFAGGRPALYDVSVDGQEALFAIAFEDGHVSRQAVYVPRGTSVLVIRSARTEPSVFSALVSTVKFYSITP